LAKTLDMVGNLAIGRSENELETPKFAPSWYLRIAGYFALYTFVGSFIFVTWV
jgi:hypothetical protein